jgi:hypothetical protein
MLAGHSSAFQPLFLNIFQNSPHMKSVFCEDLKQVRVGNANQLQLVSFQSQ